MIVVEYNGYRMALRGHAGCGKVGNDIVCAAASSLWYALLGKMEKENQEGHVTFHFIEESGNAEIEVTQIAAGHERTVSDVFDTIQCGLYLLAESYPENVTIKKSPDH